MKNYLLQNNKRKKRRDRGEMRLQTISEDKLMRRTERHRKTLSMSNIQHSEIMLFRINKIKISIVMLRNVSVNGRVKVKMSNLLLWNLKIIRRELFEINKYNK